MRGPSLGYGQWASRRGTHPEALAPASCVVLSRKATLQTEGAMAGTATRLGGEPRDGGGLK